MLSILLPTGALFCGVALLLLGSGLLNTTLAIRGTLENFSDGTMGLIGSAYFAGFFLGTFVAPRLIRRIGHIRAFAFFGAALAAIFLLYGLVVDAAFWIVLRIANGVALVGFYMVIESWLNSQTSSERRGQVFAVYMAVNLFALAAAQQLLHVGSPVGLSLFMVAAMLVCLSLMPVTITRLPQPEMHDAPHPDLRRLWRAAPVAFVGALSSGLAMGAFWSMTPVYGQHAGLAESDIGLLMTLTILGGAAMQWPIGRFADTRDRRRALAWVAGAATAAAVLFGALGMVGAALFAGAFLFGGAAFAVYPVVIAHLVDHLPRSEILAGNAGILLLHGLGAALGPALAGVSMAAIGPVALPLHFALSFAPLALFAYWQARAGRDEIVDAAAHCVPILRTSPTVLEMVAPSETEPPLDSASSSADIASR